MKQRHLWAGLVISMAMSMVLSCGASGQASAQVAIAPPPSVIITEVQTGAATASEEFVELYNSGDQPVDIAGWQLRFRNASAGENTPLLLVNIGVAHEPLLLPAHEFFVAHTASVVLPASILGQVYDAGLSAAHKTLGLYAPRDSCHLEPRDVVGWGAAPQAADTLVVEPAGEKLLQRVFDGSQYAVSSAVGYHFVAGTLATPGQHNPLALPQDMPGPDAPSLPEVLAGQCVTPQAPPGPLPSLPLPPVSPPVAELPPAEPEVAPPAAVPQVRNAGLTVPQLSEVLPNPAKPQTDAADEFIELYNSNDLAFDLSGYTLTAGTAANPRRYIFPEGTLLPGGQFGAFYARDTNLSLSNTTGRVVLLDTAGAVLLQSDLYSAAKDGQAWLYANNKWQWTATPTPGALNVLRAPAATKPAAKGAVGGSTITRPRPKVSAAPAGTVAGATTTAGGTSGKGANDASAQPAESAASFNPLHPGILALTGVIAVLYGAYEYRHDLANKLHQLRANRSARREAREAAAGRRNPGAGE